MYMLWFKFTSGLIFFLNQLKFFKLVYIFETGSYFSNQFFFLVNYL